MIKIQVPATSANLGSGFDSLGIALSLYNNVWIEEYDHIDIVSKDGLDIPKDKSNLIFWSAKYLYKMAGKKLPGLRIVQENNIPMARGLGSSSACIVAGILAANNFLGTPFSKSQLINFAAEIEGHPDNTTPAFLGGLSVTAIEDKTVFYDNVQISNKIRFAVFIPPFRLKTSVARQALPETYSRNDSVYNLSRSALIVTSLVSGNFKNLKVAVKDKLHQPYRMKFIDDLDKIFRISYNLGSYGTYITGAGPSIISIVDETVGKVMKEQVLEYLGKEGILGWKFELLKPDMLGATISFD